MVTKVRIEASGDTSEECKASLHQCLELLGNVAQVGQPVVDQEFYEGKPRFTGPKGVYVDAQGPGGSWIGEPKDWRGRMVVRFPIG